MRLAALVLAPAVATAEPVNRIGGEAWLSGGPLIALAGSIHYERGRVGELTAIVRLEAAAGLNLTDGPYADRQPISLTAGGRFYFGARGYVCGEVGPSAVRFPGSSDFISSTPTRWELGFAARAGVGAQFRSLDIGLAGSLAVIGVGVYIGGNFAAW